MTQEEVQKRRLELDLARATLLRDQAQRHYERLQDAVRMAPGAVAEQEFDDAQTTLALRQLDVEECTILLGGA